MSLSVRGIGSFTSQLQPQESSIKTVAKSIPKDSLNPHKKESCLENNKTFFTGIKNSFLAAVSAIWEWILENIFCKKEPLAKRYQKAEGSVIKSQEDWAIAREKFENVQKRSKMKSLLDINAFGIARLIQQGLEKPHSKQSVFSQIEGAHSFSDSEKLKYKKAYEESPEKLQQALQGRVLLGQFLITHSQMIAFQEYLSLDSPTPLEAQVAFTHLVGRFKEIILELISKSEPNVKTEQDVFAYLSTKEGVSKCTNYCNLYVESKFNEINISF